MCLQRKCDAMCDDVPVSRPSFEAFGLASAELFQYNRVLKQQGG